jgi:hypothetical protein
MVIAPVLAARSSWFTNPARAEYFGAESASSPGPLFETLGGFDQPPERDEPRGVVYTNTEFNPSGATEDVIGIELAVYPDGLLAGSRKMSFR